MSRFTLEVMDIPEIICPETNKTNEDDREPDPPALLFLLPLTMNIADDFVLYRPMNIDRIATLLVRFLRDGP